MVKVSNVFGDVYSGQVGKAGVFASWRGIQYRRKYVIPSNPNTPAQQKVRNSFANAVDKWHTLNSLQQQAYTPLASGQSKTGYNIFIGRWQKMTDVERAAYVSPYVGFVQVGEGSASAGTPETTVTDTQEMELAESPVVIGSCEFTTGAGNLDPKAFIDIKRGRVDFIDTITGAITIDYEAGGETVVGEAIQTNAAPGDVAYLDNMDIDYKSVALYVAESEVTAIEVDVVAGKLYVTDPATFTGGDTIAFDTFTPVEDIKMSIEKVNTSFSTGRYYSDENGTIQLSQTSEDGNKDIEYTHPDYISEIVANVSPQNTAKDQYVALTAI
jgi:hypothetical protein